MRNGIIILSAITLLTPALAHADHAGLVSPPAVGTAAPTPPVGAEGAPVPQKAAPNSGAAALGTSGNTIDNQGSSPIATGADTSTAAPGGQAESSKNGSLSTPAAGATTTRHHRKPKSAPDGATEAPK